MMAEENQNNLPEKKTQTTLELFSKAPSSISKIEEILTSKEPTLAVIKQSDEPGLLAMLVALISDLALFLNLGKQMTPIQVAETAKLVAKEFYFFKMSDFYLFFERFKTGYFGKTYDRLDGQVIMTSLREYSKERAEVAESTTLTEQEQLKEDSKLEDYIVICGSNYIRNDGEGFAETTQKDLATRYTFAKAKAIKKWIIDNKHHPVPEDVKVHHAKKPEIGLIQRLKEKNPDWFRKERRKDFTFAYKKRCEEIEQMNITPLEKLNLRRNFCNLAPLNEDEYREYLELGFIKSDKATKTNGSPDIV